MKIIKLKLPSWSHSNLFIVNDHSDYVRRSKMTPMTISQCVFDLNVDKFLRANDVLGESAVYIPEKTS